MSSTGLQSTQMLAKYRQVHVELHDAIRKGRYKVGTRLPPERELAKVLNVSPVTLRKALDLLTQDGMINRIQGNGTFVMSQEPVSDLPSESSTATKSIAWLLIDTSSDHWTDYMMYNQAEARVLDKHLARQGYSLTLIHTDSRELAAGRLPLALERGEVEGIILSGFVEDFHVLYLQNMGFKVVVLGNRPIYLPVSQIDVSTRKVSYELTKALIEATDGSVLFATRPFDCYFTFDVLAGYNQAIAEANQCSQVMVLTYTGNDEQELRRMLSKETGKFGLLVNHVMAHGVRAVYQEFGWGFDDHPIAMLSSEFHSTNPDITRQMNAHYGDLELQTAVAADLMIDTLNGGSPKKITLEPELSCTTEDGVLRISSEWHPVTIDGTIYAGSGVREKQPVGI